mgnify:FL=1
MPNLFNLNYSIKTLVATSSKMTQPKLMLYHANWSLCSQMVRVALYEKGLEFDHVPIKLCDHYEEAENISKDFLENINPTGVVPVLKINDENVRDSALRTK